MRSFRDARWSGGAPALAVVLAALTWAGSAAGQSAEWSFRDSIVEGAQIDAVRGPDGRVHVISSRYYQLDHDGAVVVDEDPGDGRQGVMDFPPAIAVGDDGSVHIVTRHDGTWTDGHDIRYRRRSSAGAWDADYVFGARTKRNYVVGVAWAGRVFMTSTQGLDNVWGDIHLWGAGDDAASSLGRLTGLWRSDADARLRGHDGAVHMVSGRPDPDGSVFYLEGGASDGLLADLEGSVRTHESGTGRRGFPDLSIDGAGRVHLTYGAESEVYYNSYGPDGAPGHAEDVLLFAELGNWHLSTGLSAVAVSEDGEVVLAVAVRADGSQGAEDSQILWASSVDGGTTWTLPGELGRTTHAGEGRRRPRLVSVGRRFFLLFGDNGTSAVGLATMDFARDADGDGFDDSIDCDDGDPAVYPGAEETCNGVDDNCDGVIDEGCPEDPDGGGEPDGSFPDADGVDADPDAEGGGADGGADADVGAGETGGGGGCSGCTASGARAQGARSARLARLLALVLRF